MRFVVSSTELYNHLQTVSRVISSKNSLPILDNFLFRLAGNELEITASDLETTLTTLMTLDNVEGDGTIAIPYKILVDILKEFTADQPLTFEINLEKLDVKISSENGHYNIVGQPADDFPMSLELIPEEKAHIVLPAELLLNGISKTIFATAEDDMRPVMNGIFVQLIVTEGIKFVASDSHKLVRYSRKDVEVEGDNSFILPKKPAQLLKNMLPKETGNVELEFDTKGARFTLSGYTVICRLVEGNYPNYSAVIPAENPYKLIIDRVVLYDALRRVSLFSNAASNLIKLSLDNTQCLVSAQDLDFSISGQEQLTCDYQGDAMEIGFKSTFLIDILANIPSTNVTLALSDPSRAGLIFPHESDNPDEDILMLLMPMMVG